MIKTEKKTHRGNGSSASKLPFLNQNGQPLADVEKEIAREALIREKAYQRFVERGYQHGNHVDDWIEAEKLINEETSHADQDYQAHKE